MSAPDDNSNTNHRDQESKPLSRAEKFALARQAQKQKLKERAREAKKAYMARPDVQAKMAIQKEKLAARRKEKSAAMKAARKAEKTALAESKKATRVRHQKKRDEELAAMLGVASQVLTPNEPSAKHPTSGRAERPQLTVISGGRSSRP